MNDEQKVGNKIRLLRRNKGYTQQKFAEILGLSTNYLSDVERGKSFSWQTDCHYEHSGMFSRRYFWRCYHFRIQKQGIKTFRQNWKIVWQKQNAHFWCTGHFTEQSWIISLKNQKAGGESLFRRLFITLELCYNNDNIIYYSLLSLF